MPTGISNKRKMTRITSQITLPIEIKNGKFASNLPMVSEILKAHEGHILDVTFKRRRNKRSPKQNNAYWGIIVPIFQQCIMDEWGEIKSKEEVHEFLKHNCNFEEIVNEDTGQVIRKVIGISENDTAQENLYQQKCRQLAYDYFNTIIPEPDPDYDKDAPNEKDIDLNYNR